jgi:hypothetical protein
MFFPSLFLRINHNSFLQPNGVTAARVAHIPIYGVEPFGLMTCGWSQSLNAAWASSPTGGQDVVVCLARDTCDDCADEAVWHARESSRRL